MLNVCIDDANYMKIRKPIDDLGTKQVVQKVEPADLACLLPAMKGDRISRHPKYSYACKQNLRASWSTLAHLRVSTLFLELDLATSLSEVRYRSQ